MIRYIHLNPVRAAMVKSPDQYRYSGHHGYLQGKPTEIIDPAPVFGLLGASEPIDGSFTTGSGTVIRKSTTL